MGQISRKLALILCFVVLILLFLVWLVVYVFSIPADEKANLHNVEIKLRLVEDELFLRSKGLGDVKKSIEALEKYEFGEKVGNGAKHSVPYVDQNNNCSKHSTSVRMVDIQMLDIYKEIPFENTDGGEWTQGWKIHYNNGNFNETNKLKVFVVPHSHNDPGWLRTFDEYHERVTQYILFNMVNFMSKNHDMKFIWAEISFFSRWYQTLPHYWKGEIKSMIDRGQLEFVTGGWVMADEANSHWLGITLQLIEGQNWLKKHLNVVPKTAWAIDPFGHSSTMAYLLKKSNMENMLIQRTHYEIKKRLAHEKQLEFYWRQIWDNTGKNDMFTHMMPFLSYSAPYSCGPDPMICCQFDFERLPGKGRTCKWGIQPEEITDANVAEKAHLLLDQWRKKSDLYKSKSLLIPLGDDFRYSHSDEWHDQYTNYKKLFKYLNDHKGLFVEAKFATLQEYFQSVRKSEVSFPTLTGDFFTYADRDDHYWSGYYTSKPYYKRMDRVLMHYIRSAEMMYSWHGWQYNSYLGKRLRNATQALSLFQHHDGITGTARERVMADYGRMLDFGVKSCKFVMQQAAYRLLTNPDMYRPNFKRIYFDMDESHWPELSDDIRTTIELHKAVPLKYVAFHNSLPQWREEVIELQVSTPYIVVTDADERPVMAQISPVWSWDNLFFNIVNPRAQSSKFILHFKVKVPPLGISTYIMQLSSTENMANSTSFANITVLTQAPFFLSLGQYPQQAQFGKPREFRLKSGPSSPYISFTKAGFLKIISGQGNRPQIPINLEFLRYETKSWFADERSGAYLFLPNGPAEPFLLEDSTVLISEGLFESSVTVGLPFAVHKTILRDNVVEVRNYIDIGDMGNNEIVMRITTNIHSGDEFYTDANGLQMMKRINFKKLPLQANYYPIPTAIYIEDELTRLTVISAQPLGGSSLIPGQIDIIQDRRLNQGDGRGLGEGVLDNRPVQHIFRLVVESRENCQTASSNYTGGALTAGAHQQLQQLLHPIDKFIFHWNIWPGMMKSFGLEHKPLNGDFEVGLLKHMTEAEKVDTREGRVPARGLIVHRTNVDRCEVGNISELANIKELLNIGDGIKLHSASLTFVKNGESVAISDVNFCPMDIKAFVIHR